MSELRWKQSLADAPGANVRTAEERASLVCANVSLISGVQARLLTGSSRLHCTLISYIILLLQRENEDYISKRKRDESDTISTQDRGPGLCIQFGQLLWTVLF